MAEFLKDKIKKSYCILKKGFSMHFGFNNQFIKVMRTRPIFQKEQKNLFCFLLILRIMRLYVRHILDIKKVVLLMTLEWLSLT
jgi:hypothetical protein